MKKSDLEMDISRADSHFETLFSEIPVPTAIYIGRDMVIQSANEEMLKLWGKDAGVVGKTLREALPELEGQPFHGLLEQVFTTGVAYQTEEGRADLVVDGVLQTFYFNFTYKPLRDTQGITYGILNLAVDVTSHVRVKQQLQKAEERMDFALGAAEIGTWELMPDHKHIRWDRRCEQLLGTDPRPIISYKAVLGHIHPDDKTHVVSVLSHALKPSSGGNFDLTFRASGATDGKVRFVRVKGKALFDAEGKLTRFAGIMLDVSREKLMDEEQKKLLTLVDNSAELMSILGNDGKNSYVNKAGMALLGFDSLEEVANTPIAHLHAPEHFAMVENEVLPSIEKNGRWSGEMLVRHLKTGEVFPVYNSSIRIDDPFTGETVAVGAVMRDLRPEMEAREAIIKSEQLLRNITTASPAALWMANEDGHTTYVNQTWLDWTGMPFTGNMDWGWTNAILPEDRQRVITTFITDLKERRESEIEFRLDCHGTIKWCISNAKPQFDQDGKFWGYVGSCTDVTELKEFELRLLESTNKLISILEGLPQIAYTATAEGKIDYFSQKWYDYSGLSPEASLDDPAQIVHKDDQPKLKRNWKVSMLTAGHHHVEVRLRSREGAYRWYLSAASPIKNYKGEVVSWAGTLTDIHEQKELQRQKDDFLGIASHELKTPVTSIKAYTQILEAMFRKSGDTAKADMVRKMDTQVNRLTNLIGDLLDVTKIQTGKIQFSREHFDFNAMVAEIVEELQHTTNKHRIIQHFNETGVVFADKYRIGQVITNLMSNAIKYSPNADKILIYTRRENNEVSLCVQDFGIGISREKKDRVFEQFYRVSGDVQFTFSGLGLGLYISSEIIKREGGRIWVNSVEGKGSTFCFSIPATRKDEQAIET